MPTRRSRDRSSLARRNIHAGKAAQRDAGRYFCDQWGVTDDGCSWTQHHPDLIFSRCPGAGWHWEVKWWEQWDPKQWIRQAEHDSDTDRWTVVIKRPSDWRRYAAPWYCLIPEHRLQLAVEVAFTNRLSGRPVPCGIYRAIGWTHFDHSDSPNAWHLTDWIRQAEQHMKTWSNSAWTFTVRPPADGYRSEAYGVVPGATWAHVLERCWEGRSGGAGGTEKEIEPL